MGIIPKREYEGGTGPLADSIIGHSMDSNGFVVELGVHGGDGSTAMIQEGLEHHLSPLHISVDWEDIIKEGCRPAVPWWHQILGDSRSAETLSKAVAFAGGRKAGMIFIDTDHNYHQMRAELELWKALADDETVWLGHDSWMFGVFNTGMMLAVTEFAEANGLRYEDYRQDSHGLWRMKR